MKRTARWPGIVIAVLMVVTSAPPPAYADGEGPTILSINQEDLNGDGRLDVTVIDAAFATEHDRITVFDRGRRMIASTDWREAAEFENDIWLYDIGVDGTVQLIVVYQIERGHATAYVYDDQDGDGQVAHELNGTQVVILESPYWTARFISDSDWFLPDGRVNLNLRIELDGPIPTFDRAPDAYTREWLAHDGLIDAEFEEVADREGIAHYALKRLQTESPADWGFERAGLHVNEGHYPTGAFDRAFFPLLPVPIDPRDPAYANLRYFDLPPNLKVDWLRGKILAMGLDGYPIGHGYHFNDNRYIVNGEVNDVAFETPQAYYDLANNRDAFAEMHIRVLTHPPDDRTTWAYPGLARVPWQSIRIDWNLFNLGTQRWDFKVGLGGNHLITETTQFPDFAVRMAPFDELPFWITEREWKLATFVAREGEGYESSEGIYEWQTDTGDDPQGDSDRAVEAREASQAYMLGVSTDPPEAYFTTARPGFRAERHFAGPIQPYLYFSPIDRKLHLRGAEAGLWNIDDRTTIEIANLDNDAYLDHWQYRVDGRLSRQLAVSGSYLVYAGENSVSLRQVNTPPSLFESLPPRTHGEWLSLKQQLEANQPAFAPGDFKAMLAQFDGPEWQVADATLRDFRPDGNGFRFILTLQPGFQALGSGGPDLTGLQPGAYVVAYHDTFTVEPLAPLRLSASVSDAPLTQFESGALPVQLWNDGSEDLPEATLELLARPPQGQATVVATQTATLLAESSLTLKLQWAPPMAGEWVLTPQIRQPDGQRIALEPKPVMVLPARSAAPDVLIAESTAPEDRPIVLLGPVAFAGMAAFIFWRYWKKSSAQADREV